MAVDNKTIGRFQLTGIPPAPRGIPQIEVSFDIDANGILHVHAKDKATGKEQSIVIQASSGLNDSEIERMVKDAESHAAEDQEKRKRVEARNNADSLLYQARKTLKDLEDKADAVSRDKVESAIADLEGVLNSEDLSVLESKSTALSEALQELGQKVHQQAQEAQHASSEGQDQGAQKDGSSADEAAGEGPMEAEYEVVDEDKKS
jgi:molecular chaperone DnaK